MKKSNERSPHVLNASSNLLGLCFVVLTSLKLLKLSDLTLIDEITVATTLLFMTSCILSFMAIRGSFRRGPLWEYLADILFLCGLGTLVVTTLLFSFNIIP